MGNDDLTQQLSSSCHNTIFVHKNEWNPNPVAGGDHTENGTKVKDDEKKAKNDNNF